MCDKRRILVVDDHPVFREGLVRVLNQDKDLQVVGEAADVNEALKLAQSQHPDLAIVDISLEGSNGLDLTQMLRTTIPHIKILILSMHKESLHAERALRAGANGYVMKSENSQHLLAAVHDVLNGKTHLSEPMKERMLQKLYAAPGTESLLPEEALSDREFEIFQFIGQGYGTRQIADELHLSMKTVESHREHIREKMHLSSTFELVQRAIHWAHNENPSANH